MIVLSNNAEVTVQPGQAIPFNETVFRCGRNEIHRNNSAEVSVRNCGIYSLSFNGNIGGETAATAVQLAISTGGMSGVFPETTMISVPAAVADRNNVGAGTITCSGNNRNTFSVVNTGTVPVVIAANSSFRIQRIS